MFATLIRSASFAVAAAVAATAHGGVVVDMPAPGKAVRPAGAESTYESENGGAATEPGAVALWRYAYAREVPTPEPMGVYYSSAAWYGGYRISLSPFALRPRLWHGGFAWPVWPVWIWR